MIKKLVRFGNLDPSLRKFFWKKLCDYSSLEESLWDQLGIEDESMNVYRYILELIENEK